MKLPIIILVKLYWDTHDITTSKDRLLRDYNIVLMESAMVASFDGFLFGSLLNVSVRNANQVIYSEIILRIALFSIAITVLLFVMPVIYHHLQFPYGDL
jgi:hypothetical protein